VRAQLERRAQQHAAVVAPRDFDALRREVQTGLDGLAQNLLPEAFARIAKIDMLTGDLVRIGGHDDFLVRAGCSPPRPRSP